MRNSWFLWVLIVGVVVAVLIVFNYQGAKETIPLSEIFPEEQTFPVDVEYEFVDADDVIKSNAEQAGAIKEVPQKASSVVKKQTPQSPRAPEVDLTNIPFTIQVASFKKKAKAEEVLETLKQKDYPAYIVSKELGDKGTWHRVYVGKFTSKSDADNFLVKLREDYKDSFVISPQ